MSLINADSEIPPIFSMPHACAIDDTPSRFRNAVICACVRKLVKHSSQVLAVLVIVQVRCCPAVMLPLHSLLKVVVKLGDAVSVTLNVPGLNVTSVPVAEPGKLAGVGLLPITCIVKLAGVAVVSPFTIFITVNVAVVGDGVGVGVGVGITVGVGVC